MKWAIFLFIFLLPLYTIRLPLYLGGESAGIPFLEMAAYLIAAVIFLQDSKGSMRALKEFFTKNKLFSVGLLFLWAGLLLGIFQSNSALVSAGIVRGWFFAPFVWFLALIMVRARNYKQLRFYIVGALASSAVAISAIALFSQHFNQDARLLGIYSSPNYLAMYVAPLIPLVAYEAYRSYKLFAPASFWQVIQKYIWVFALGVCLLGVLFSFSFGSWLGLAVAAGGLLLFSGLRFHKKIVLPAILIASAGLLAGVVIFHARLIEKIDSRLGLWHAAWNIGSNHPLLGIGEGMFQTAYQVQKHIVAYPVPLESALHPHNIFFTFWLYAGLLGLIGFFCILAWIALKIFYRLKQNPNDFLAIAVACSFLIILVHGLVDTTYWKNDLAFMWWTLMILLV